MISLAALTRSIRNATLITALLLLTAVSTVSAADDDPTGSTTAYATLLIVATIGIVLVIIWMVANRMRKPPRG